MLAGASLGFEARAVVMTMTLSRMNRDPEHGAQVDAFAAEKVSEEYRDDGVDVRVGAYACGRLVVDEPEVGGEADDGSGDDEVEERDPGSARDCLRVEAGELATRGCGDREHDATREHLCAGAEDLG